MKSTIFIFSDYTSFRQRLATLLEKQDHSIIAMSGDGEVVATLEQEDIAVMIIEIDLQIGMVLM